MARSYDNRNPHKRYVSLRAKDCSNNNIERFQGTFRQRDKVMKGFKGNQKQYAKNFRTYYNFVKKHETLGMTPSQRAGIKNKAEWKELLTKALQQPISVSAAITAAPALGNFAGS